MSDRKLKPVKGTPQNMLFRVLRAIFGILIGVAFLTILTIILSVLLIMVLAQ